jgi:hypothetical protein
MIQTFLVFFQLMAVAVSTSMYIEVKHFTISPCLKNCPVRCGLISSEETENEFNLKFGAYFNCSLSPEDSVEAKYYNDTLRIKVWHPDKIIYLPIDSTFKTNRDSLTTLVPIRGYKRIREMADCDCYYEIELTMEKLQKKPLAFLVNGKTLEQYLEFDNGIGKEAPKK